MLPQQKLSAMFGLRVRVSGLPATALLALGMLAQLSGCKVTEQDVDTWKGTVKGPGKMVAVMMADKYGIPLRTHSALALIEMDRRDVDGVAELQNALQKLVGDTRSQIIKGMVPGLVKQMNDKGEEGEGSAASPSQIRAKDAAFLLVPMADDGTRQKLTEAVVDWYVEDFNGRNLSGNFSAEQVVRALGAPAAKRLVEALDPKIPQQALIKLAELIGQLGRPETKQKAGQKLVDIEAEMRSPEFGKWLQQQITAQLEGAGSKGKVDPKKVAKMAELNRANFIESGVLPAMKHLADQPAVATRLLAIASDKNPALTVRRTRALQALEGKARSAHLDQLLALALDPGNPVPVRDYAFDRVGDIRSPKAIEPMWPLVQSKKDGRLRWRAGELILAIGGSGILSEFLAKLPAEGGIAYEPEELEGYATRMGQMTPLPTEIAKAQLASPDWWDQVLALKYFERKGTLSDVAAMQRLVKSTTRVTGKHWGKAKTVGKVAQQAIAGLRERLKQASGGASKGEAS